MSNNLFPRVLIVDVNAWREDSAAHTLLDIFRCWDAQRLALVYTSSQLPNTEVCHRFFQISESQIIRSVTHPLMRVGGVVKSTPLTDDEDALAEQARYARGHKSKAPWLRLAREMVWKFGHWKTQALRDFVLDFNPDIIFVPIFPNAYMGRIQQYIISLTRKPTVCYLADDNYSYDSCANIFDYIHRFWTRQFVGPLARSSKRMFVIVDREKVDTDERFGTDSVILTKSIDFTGKTFIPKKLNNPLRLIYTGSLIIGRDRTLCAVADAVNAINQNGIKAELLIYSQTEPTDEVLSHIHTGASHFCGLVPHQEIARIQQEADVVVFAEGLEGKEANVAKLSFSTKITDYISAGKCVLAIGKADIAPIDYFQRNDAALIAHNVDEIKTVVERIVNNPDIINEYGAKAFHSAVRNHEKSMMEERFVQTMLDAAYN